MQPSRVTYERYITSDAWAAVRRRVLRRRGRRCQCCATNERLHVHHGTYERFGAERDADLFVLCQRCHAAVHQYHRDVGGNLMAATRRVIESAQRRRVKVEPRREPPRLPAVAPAPRAPISRERAIRVMQLRIDRLRLIRPDEARRLQQQLDRATLGRGEGAA